MYTATQARSRNRILAALPDEEYARLLPHLEQVSVELSEILFRPDDVLRYVYFPETCIISLLTDLSDGYGIEVGLVGKEGMAGVSIALGSDKEPKVATVQGAGTLLRLKASVLRDETRRGGMLQAYLLRYTHALMAQISQSVVCNIRHPIEGRLARWMLMYHDRVGKDEFKLTHEFIANMLGIRRAGVSMVANKLKRAGLIDYYRGLIKILDRQGLEDMTCECYPVVKAEFDSLYEHAAVPELLY
ncbi:MAG TPA: Crp/Fnr family transcriptional regulator [Pyrinomonadaceae bacterium]|jgi:CRP-like cAMP-binding protein